MCSTRYNELMRESTAQRKRQKLDANDAFLKERRAKDDRRNSVSVTIRDGDVTTTEEVDLNAVIEDSNKGGWISSFINSPFAPCWIVMGLLVVIMIAVTENSCSKRGKTIFKAPTQDAFCLS